MFVAECKSRTNLSKKSESLQLFITKVSILIISIRCLFSNTKMFFFVSVKVILQILIPSSPKTKFKYFVLSRSE